MKTEVLCNEPSFNLILECLFESANKKVDGVCMPSGLVKKVDSGLLIGDTYLSSIIDFPYGISDTQIRVHQIFLSSSRAASVSDIVINIHDLESKNMFSIMKDLSTCLTASNTRDMSLRPVIEYRVSDERFVFELCKEIASLGIQEVVIGTGALVDDLIDNIILSKLIEEKIGLEVISCSPILSKEHYDMFLDSEISGIRVKSFRLLDNFVY